MTESESVLRDIIIDGNGCDYDESISQSIFEEIQQYRELGTVEEILKVFNNQQTIIATQHETVKQYRAIGTIEEFKALKEKDTPMELAEHNFQDEVHHYLCPRCRSIVSCNQNYCEECGQALET